MTHTIKRINPHSPDRGVRYAEGETVLDAIGNAGIVSIAKQNDGTFYLHDCYDGYHGCELTRDQLLALATEITEMAK